MKPPAILTLAFAPLACVMFAQTGDAKFGDTPQRTSLTTSTTPETTLSLIENKAGHYANPDEYLEHSGMYLFPGWEEGYAVLRDQTIMDGLKLRYDIYHQQIQFIQAGDTLAFADPEELNYISIAGRKFIYTDYSCDRKLSKGYFEVLSDGDCKLLKRKEILYHYAGDNESYSENEKYYCQDQPFIKKPSEPARMINLCKKSILCAFKDKEDQVKGFIKNNKLNMKNCADVMVVVEFYNSLQ